MMKNRFQQTPAKKHYFELGLLLQAMADDDAHRAIHRLRNLAQEHKHNMEIFPAYMLALDWIATRKDTRSERQGLYYLESATFAAGVDFCFFESQHAKEKLADYIIEGCLRFAYANHKEADKRIWHLGEDCKKQDGYDYSAIAKKVEAAEKKIDDIGEAFKNRPDYFCTEGWHFRYDICRISWLENKWLDAIRKRDNPQPYRDPEPTWKTPECKPQLLPDGSMDAQWILEHGHKFVDPRAGRENVMEDMLEHAYANKEEDPFQGNPNPSVREVGEALLATAAKICGDQDPEKICDIAKYWIEKDVPADSFLAQAAQTLRKKTVAAHAVTMEVFMARAQEILTKTPPRPSPSETPPRPAPF